jgi:hypothetical protein
MKKPNLVHIFISYCVLSVFLFHPDQLVEARNLSGILLKSQGDVQYYDGRTWRPINYDKFLFDGYAVKTGEQGLCKVVIIQNGKFFAIGNNSEIKIENEEINIISGYIGKASAVGIMLASLPMKYQKAINNQYVTRSVGFDTAKTIFLAASHPYLVWNNLGNNYSYRLHLGEKIYHVPTSSNKIIKYKLNLYPGRYKYYVEALNNGLVEKCSARNNYVTWLSALEIESFDHEMESLRQLNNEFLLASAYEQFGLKIPAMFLYQKYFKENPTTDPEMKDILTNLYRDLKLVNMLIEQDQVHPQKKKGGCLMRWLLWPFSLFF